MVNGKRTIILTETKPFVSWKVKQICKYHSRPCGNNKPSARNGRNVEKQTSGCKSIKVECLQLESMEFPFVQY